MMNLDSSFREKKENATSRGEFHTCATHLKLRRMHLLIGRLHRHRCVSLALLLLSVVQEWTNKIAFFPYIDTGDVVYVVTSVQRYAQIFPPCPIRPEELKIVAFDICM